jgi:hypothetical protein
MRFWLWGKAERGSKRVLNVAWRIDFMLKESDSIVWFESDRVGRIGWMVGAWAFRTKADETNRLLREKTDPCLIHFRRNRKAHLHYNRDSREIFPPNHAVDRSGLI